MSGNKNEDEKVEKGAWKILNWIVSWRESRRLVESVAPPWQGSALPRVAFTKQRLRVAALRTRTKQWREKISTAVIPVTSPSSPLIELKLPEKPAGGIVRRWKNRVSGNWRRRETVGYHIGWKTIATVTWGGSSWAKGYVVISITHRTFSLHLVKQI